MFCVLNSHAAMEPLSTPQPKTFQSWKDLQILEAQNQMLRIGARMTQIKAGKGARAEFKEPSQLPTGRVRSTNDSDPMALAERDLRRARESLETATALDLTDYVNIYLPTLESQPETLQALLQKLTKEELAEILKVMLSKSSRIDAKRN